MVPAVNDNAERGGVRGVKMSEAATAAEVHPDRTKKGGLYGRQLSYIKDIYDQFGG